MRQRVVKALNRAGLDAVSVENPAYPGTPDINYVGGWLELKWVKEWPSDDRPVQIRHFTPQQRCWLIRRWLAAEAQKAGWAWLIIQIEKSQEWLIFNGKIAGLYVVKSGAVSSKEGLLAHADAVVAGPGEVVAFLENRRSASLA